MKKEKKIKIIKAYNKFGVLKYTWNADSLKWTEIPKWLLFEIKKEFPDYKLVIETYYLKSKKVKN